MTDLNGIKTIERDDPRFTAIADATSFSGFTALAEPDPERPSNRRIFAMALIALFLGLFFANVAFFGSMLFTEEFRARVEVQYRGSAWTETQDVAVQSRSLTQPIANKYGVPIKDFEENLDAGLVPGTQILRIDYIDSDKATAEAIVFDLSDAYIEEIRELPSSEAVTLIQDQLSVVEAEIDATQAELGALSEQIDADRLAQEEAKQAENAARFDEAAEDAFDPDDLISTSQADRAEQTRLFGELSTLRARKNNLDSRLLDLQLREFEKLENGSPERITEPFTFDDPVFPRPRLFAAIGMILGLALGGIIMLLNWNHTAWSSIEAITRRLPGGPVEAGV